MSRRVAIRKELAGAAGGAVAGRAAGMALGSVVPVIGTAIGGAVGSVLGSKLGDKATDKAGEMSSNQSFTDKIKERGKAAADAGAAYAQANQQAQHRMEERGQAMADKAKAGSQIATGEPMELSWRMLKGELQLPHQITEALRDDLSTLDRAHKMTDTNEGTLIENIHPDMEQVVKLLAEKHLGEMSPSMSRPTTPLFHGPFH